MPSKSRSRQGHTFDDDMKVLQREFEGEAGSFLIQLRCEARWDRDAFTRLVLAMEGCARGQEGRKTLPRWVAHGFWFLEWNAAAWAESDERHSAEEKSYYRLACQRLSDLAHWLFFGESPYQGSGPLPPI